MDELLASGCKSGRTRARGAGTRTSPERVTTPKLTQSSVAAAAVSVELILERVLLIEILVVVLSREERRGADDLGLDRLAEPLRLFERAVCLSARDCLNAALTWAGLPAGSYD